MKTSKPLRLTIILETPDGSLTHEYTLPKMSVAKSVTLLGAPGVKVALIKAVRNYTGLSLQDSRAASEKTTVFYPRDMKTDPSLSGEMLTRFADELRDAGGVVILEQEGTKITAFNSIKKLAHETLDNFMDTAESWDDEPEPEGDAWRAEAQE